ncbi:unnamed protein product, partial [marine sediment metagenome]
AREFSPAGSWYKGDAAASCIFEMAGGEVFTYAGSWCSEGCNTSWNGDWRFVGEKGSMVYDHDGDPHGELVARPADKGFFRPLKPLKVSASPVRHLGMRGGLREMLAFLRTGKVPQTECHDNIKSLAMVFAAMESAAKGRPVPVRAM